MSLGSSNLPLSAFNFLFGSETQVFISRTFSDFCICHDVIRQYDKDIPLYHLIFSDSLPKYLYCPMGVSSGIMPINHMRVYKTDAVFAGNHDDTAA